MIEYDRSSPEQLHQMKIDAQRKVVRKIDEDKAREEGREEGKKIGESIGEKRGKIETAINLLKIRIDIDTIVKATGLPRKPLGEGTLYAAQVRLCWFSFVSG